MIISKLVLSPVLKWAGGKRKLVDVLRSMMPTDYSTYCEPFLGGAAMLLAIQPQKAVVSDINADLINVYQVIKSQPLDLISLLEQYPNDSDFFYQLRSADRDPSFVNMSPLLKAARFIYLNKTCFNGLYRVNSKNQFNAPFGRYQNPQIVNAEGILGVSQYLNTADVQLVHKSFSDTLDLIPETAFVYLDPPYHDTFTQYSQQGFSESDQIKLRKFCDALTDKGARFMLSNSDTPFIREQYAAYNITTVSAARTISAKSDSRGIANEVVVRNYS